MKWLRQGIFLCATFASVLAQEGYNYPKPDTPFSGGSPSPSGKPDLNGYGGPIQGTTRPGSYELNKQGIGYQGSSEGQQPSSGRFPSPQGTSQSPTGGYPTQQQPHKPSFGQPQAPAVTPQSSGGYSDRQQPGGPLFGQPQGPLGSTEASSSGYSGQQQSSGGPTGNQQGYNYPTPQKTFQGGSGFPTPSPSYTPATNGFQGSLKDYPGQQQAERPTGSEGQEHAGTGRPNLQAEGAQKPYGHSERVEQQDLSKQYPTPVGPVGGKLPSGRPQGQNGYNGIGRPSESDKPSGGYSDRTPIGNQAQQGSGSYPGPGTYSELPTSTPPQLSSLGNGHPTSFIPRAPEEKGYPGLGDPLFPSLNSQQSPRQNGYSGSQGSNGYPSSRRPTGQEFPSSRPQQPSTPQTSGASEQPGYFGSGSGQQTPGSRPPFGGQQGTLPQRPSTDYLPPKQTTGKFPATSGPSVRPAQFPTLSKPAQEGTQVPTSVKQGVQFPTFEKPRQGQPINAQFTTSSSPGQYPTSRRPGQESAQFPTAERQEEPGRPRQSANARPAEGGTKFPTAGQGSVQFPSAAPGKQISSQVPEPAQESASYPRPDQPGQYPSGYGQAPGGGRPENPQYSSENTFRSDAGQTGPSQGSGSSLASPGGIPQGFQEQPSDSSDDGQYEGDYSAIPGQPEVNYPVLSYIAETSFRCEEQSFPGYFADIEARCQVFHICANNKTYDFLCPNGTIFHQEHLVCVWWNQFDCNTAPSLFGINENIYDFSLTGVQQTGGIPAPGQYFPLAHGGVSVGPQGPGSSYPSTGESQRPGASGSISQEHGDYNTGVGSQGIGRPQTSVGGLQKPGGYPIESQGVGSLSESPELSRLPAQGLGGAPQEPKGYPSGGIDRPSFPLGGTRPQTAVPGIQRPEGYPGGIPQGPKFPQVPSGYPSGTSQILRPRDYADQKPQHPGFSPVSNKGSQTNGYINGQAQDSETQRPGSYAQQPSFPQVGSRTPYGTNQGSQGPQGYPSVKAQESNLPPHRPAKQPQPTGGYPSAESQAVDYPSTSTAEARPDGPFQGTGNPQISGDIGSQTNAYQSGGLPKPPFEVRKPEGYPTGRPEGPAFAPESNAESQNFPSRPGTPFPGSPKPHQPTRDYLPPVM